MSVKLLTEHHLEFLSLKEGCTGSSESTHVEMPHCWKSHPLAQLMISVLFSGSGKEKYKSADIVEPSNMACNLYQRTESFVVLTFAIIAIVWR